MGGKVNQTLSNWILDCPTRQKGQKVAKGKIKMIRWSGIYEIIEII